ncbi:hypothetical protein ASF77_03115 [Massilia sp. Leaf139]|nr:hypothetical protein ASF77_03115 [Massilia sp. Leaf139]
MLAAALGTCMMAGAAEAPPDTDKLRLLACDMPAMSPAGGKAATEWFNVAAQALPGDGGLRLAGPVELGKACMKNVTMSGGFGVVFVQGEICNTRLDDFTDTLAGAGVRLEKASDARMPEMMLSMEGEERHYMVTRGMPDMRTGKVTPASTPYAFTCIAKVGGHQ